MGHFLNFNGKIYRSDNLFIGANNRSLRYGDGLFETMIIQEGKLVMAEDHFNRLWHGMELLQFEFTKNFTHEALTKQALALLPKNLLGTSARIRITVFRGDGGLYDAKNNLPNYIIQMWALPEGQPWNSNGLVTGIYEDARKSCDVFSNLKHNNFLPYIMGALHAKKMKWNDAIVLNSHGRICESTISNVFLVKDGKLFTPALTEGCIAGIMRKYMLAKIPDLGYEIIKKEITREELMNADEVFFTNAVSPIRWVKEINGKEFGDTITQKIHAGLGTIR